jgi:hypothetical protein
MEPYLPAGSRSDGYFTPNLFIIFSYEHYGCLNYRYAEALSSKSANEVEIQAGQRSADLVHSTAYHE